MAEEIAISTYGLALIGGGFTIVGALLGAWITYRFSVRLTLLNAKREAGIRLRAAFATELGALDPVAGDKIEAVNNYLVMAFPKHRDAVMEFAYYLKGTERECFKSAWKEYYEVGGSVRFFDYIMSGTKHEQFDMFNKRVDAILEFTRNN